LPSGWEIYSISNRKPAQPRGVAKWKYVVWAIVLAVLATIAFSLGALLNASKDRAFEHVEQAAHLIVELLSYFV